MQGFAFLSEAARNKYNVADNLILSRLKVCSKTLIKILPKEVKNAVSLLMFNQTEK